MIVSDSIMIACDIICDIDRTIALEDLKADGEAIGCVGKFLSHGTWMGSTSLGSEWEIRGIFGKK